MFWIIATLMSLLLVSGLIYLIVKIENIYARWGFGCLTLFILFLLIFIFIPGFSVTITNFIFIRPEIYGEIIDRETKKPIENALVVFSWSSKNNKWREYDATITDEKGYYRLPRRWVISTPGMIEWPQSVFKDKRDGCVLVAWFPGYFRSEKWESGRALIKGRQDFALQKAKTREEVVRSLEENVGIFIGGGYFGALTPSISEYFISSRKKIKRDKWVFYNPKNIDATNHYKEICKRLENEYNIKIGW
jgi:hypothetical protein